VISHHAPRQTSSHGCGDQILEGDFDFAEAEVDAEQPEQADDDDRAEHAEAKVMPESETLFAEGYEPARERAGKRAPMIIHTMILPMVMVWMV
jgi:hypothetical protein